MATSTLGLGLGAMLRRHLTHGIKLEKNVSSFAVTSASKLSRRISSPASLQSLQHTRHASVNQPALSNNQASLLHKNFESVRTCSSLVKSSLPSNSSDVIQSVNTEVAQGQSRLFAVIYVSGLQHKVTTGDLVQIQNHIQADVGERIRLEKVLLVGGDNFSLIGKPLLSLDAVRIEATVMEKTVSNKKIVFRYKRRKRFSNYKEKEIEQTVLRINSIEVSPQLR